jgi:hypothetical protein
MRSQRLASIGRGRNQRFEARHWRKPACVLAAEQIPLAIYHHEFPRSAWDALAATVCVPATFAQSVHGSAFPCGARKFVQETTDSGNNPLEKKKLCVGKGNES